jgi:hypothetical protein
MSFDVLIENKRGHAVTVYNLDGSILARIGSRESFRCSADDPYLPLARYDRIVFSPGGIDLSVRPGWVEPERRWPVKLELVDGTSPEFRFFKGAPLCLMKGIPVIVDAPANHEWAIFDRIRLNVATQRRIESKEHDGIYEFVTELADEPVLRTEAELERLQSEIDAARSRVPEAVKLTPEDEAASLSVEAVSEQGDN